MLDPNNPFGGVLVQNYANEGRVNGPATGTSGSGGSSGRFIASVPNSEDPSKLNVGFALGNSNTPLIGAPYWVVYINETYDLAIITGGAPTRASADGKCSMEGTGGFWLFSRNPTVGAEGKAQLLEVAAQLGLDTSGLIDVPQEGCLYAGA